MLHGARVHLEEQLVVDLQDHLDISPPRYFLENAVHGDLDEVGGGALDYGIHGRAVRRAAMDGALRAYLGYRPLTVQNRPDEAVRLRIANDAVEKRSDAAVTGKVGIDEAASLRDWYPHLARKAVRRLPVYDAEVDRLCLAAHLGGDLVLAHTVNLGGDMAVDIPPCHERLRQALVAREVRQHSQLYLRVVRREQHRILSACDERPAYLPAEFRAYGDVLQVRGAA